MHIPGHARGEHELWTPALMRDALVHAFRVLRALPAQGHRLQPAGWTEFNDAWGYADERKNDDRLRPNRDDIGHMEVLLIGQGAHRALLQGDVLAHRSQRFVLVTWAMWVAYGCRDREGEPETDEHFARRIHCSEATMKRHRDRAASVMAQQANRQDIAVWHVEKPARARKRNLQATGSA